MPRLSLELLKNQLSSVWHKYRSNSYGETDRDWIILFFSELPLFTSLLSQLSLHLYLVIPEPQSCAGPYIYKIPVQQSQNGFFSFLGHVSYFSNNQQVIRRMLRLRGKSTIQTIFTALAKACCWGWRRENFPQTGVFHQWFRRRKGTRGWDGDWNKPFRQPNQNAASKNSKAQSSTIIKNQRVQKCKGPSTQAMLQRTGWPLA